MSGAVFSAQGVTKAFPGVLALDRVNLTLSPRSIHALLGENGAGKSTLIKIMTGVHRPDSGTMEHQRTFRSALRGLETAGGVRRRPWEYFLHSARTVPYNSAWNVMRLFGEIRRCDPGRHRD